MDADSQAASAERALQELQQAVQAAGTTRRGARASSSANEGGMRQVEELERRALRVKNAVDSYRLETRALSSEEQTVHSQRLKAIEEGLRLARQQIEWKRYDASTAAGDGAAGTSLAESGPEQPMTLEQAVATADRIQDQSHASVNRSMGMALQAEQVGIATLQKMHEQEEQMDSIVEEMEDVKANIKRSKKLVGQIARSAMSDRCIQALCVLITIAVMVMIVLAMVGKDGGNLAVPTEVREVGQ